MADLQGNALLALMEIQASDLVAIRCVKAGIPFPADWITYIAALRQVTEKSDMPIKPPYPAGT